MLSFKELRLSGYEKLNTDGFASPVYTLGSKGNLRYRAIANLDTDYQYRIKDFEEIVTGTSYFDLPAEMISSKRVSSIWTDVFTWKDKVFVGTRRQIAVLLEDHWDDITKQYPLTSLDLIEDLDTRKRLRLTENALRYLSERFGIEKSLDWMSNIYIRNEVITSYRVTLLNLNAAQRELDAVNNIEITRIDDNIVIELPKPLKKYDINPAKLPRVSQKIAELSEFMPSIVINTDSQLNKLNNGAGFLRNNYSLPREATATPNIAAVGIGGAGSNTINHMKRSEINTVKYLSINTDKIVFENSKADRRLLIGKELMKGLGSGLIPYNGERAAQESIQEILSHLEGFDMVFLIAGMGGGTGSGATKVIAKELQKQGILTIACLTSPFSFEGLKRTKIAETAIKSIYPYVDSMIHIQNNNLLSATKSEISLATAFDLADRSLSQIVRTITDLMFIPGIINIDFEDVKSLVEDKGMAFIGSGEASGTTRALEAAKLALTNPLIGDFSIKSAKAVLINVTGGSNLTLFEIEEAASFIRSFLEKNTHVLVGSVLNEALENNIQVSIFASGIISDSILTQLTPDNELNKIEYDYLEHLEMYFEQFKKNKFN